MLVFCDVRLFARQQSDQEVCSGMHLSFLLLMKAVVETDSSVIKIESFYHKLPLCVSVGL